MKFLYSDLNQYKPSLKPVLNDIEAVYQALYNLFGTSSGERLFRPEIEGDVEDELFEFIDEDNTFSVLNLLIQKVERFEPRVIPDFQQSTVEITTDNNSYKLFLIFKVKGYGNENFKFSGEFVR